MFAIKIDDCSRKKDNSDQFYSPAHIKKLDLVIWSVNLQVENF